MTGFSYVRALRFVTGCPECPETDRLAETDSNGGVRLQACIGMGMHNLMKVSPDRRRRVVAPESKDRYTRISFDP